MNLVLILSVLYQWHIHPDKMPAEEATEEVLDGEEYPDGKEIISLFLHILDWTEI